MNKSVVAALPSSGRRSRSRGVRRQAWREPLALAGAAGGLFWLIVALTAPYIAGSPLKVSSAQLQAPSLSHPFGTDELGRDVLDRVIWGSRTSILPALILVAISLAVGLVLGAIAAYRGGIVDEVIMRVADLAFAFPSFILAMAVAASLGAGLRNAVIAIAIVRWPATARVVRGMILSLRDVDYVSASRLLGASSTRALRVEVMPSVIGPVGVLAALDVGSAILVLSGLAFLGLGNDPPSPEWGAMIADGVNYFQSWWLALAPGLAILSVVAAFNFMGDALRDMLDPRTSRSVEGR
jgi:peptide/nickel transport system permease protein